MSTCTYSINAAASAQRFTMAMLVMVVFVVVLVLMIAHFLCFANQSFINVMLLNAAFLLDINKSRGVFY
jgi:hypothetical protein